ncbi:hypothetical protein [Flavobacterium humidisoli]|uniref:Uncharacterized protein n=1 Tax=Flavobacterium humidisoli TaxID=2937442 RepID=A0ABY4LYY3_9FLAO|nr:hypothetical protein [Flavobacterium humidisoli]UPZ16900.1 hypothetical protein M0M44_06020 [Flavobacterium humidisoli]
MNQLQNNVLSSAISLIKKIESKIFEGSFVSGTISLTSECINDVKVLKNRSLIELFTGNYTSIDNEELDAYLNDDLRIEIKIGDIPNYYYLLDDFVSGNKFECVQNDYFIEEINYRKGIDVNSLIAQYENNLLIIDFLQNIAENKKTIGHRLELFFYKSGKGADLKIEYDIKQLKKFNISVPSDIKKQLLDSFSGNDKKQLFINELVIFIEKYGNSYVKLVENWDNLMSNYEKSYALFISGFSFEKIKTSSNEHFQKLVDRIYDSISKASNYIFGIPIGYILLLNNFDFTGSLILKNLGLLILSLIFFILIRCVLFKNIRESIKAIENDIDDFVQKIKDVNELQEIYNRLEKLKKQELKKQEMKLSLVKILTTVIFAITVFSYLYIFIDLSIFLLPF